MQNFSRCLIFLVHHLWTTLYNIHHSFLAEMSNYIQVSPFQQTDYDIMPFICSRALRLLAAKQPQSISDPPPTFESGYQVLFFCMQFLFFNQIGDDGGHDKKSKHFIFKYHNLICWFKDILHSSGVKFVALLLTKSFFSGTTGPGLHIVDFFIFYHTWYLLVPYLSHCKSMVIQIHWGFLPLCVAIHTENLGHCCGFETPAHFCTVFSHCMWVGFQNSFFMYSSNLPQTCSAESALQIHNMLI